MTARRWLTGGLLALPLTLPLVLPNERLLYLAALWAVFALAAHGLGFLHSKTGILSLAHAALWGVGAYTAALLYKYMGIGFWAALIPATVAGGLIALLVGLPSLRVAGHYFVIATFAFGEFLRLVGNSWQSVTNGQVGLVVPERIILFGAPVRSSVAFFYFAMMFLYVGLLATAALMRSRHGRRFIAIRENEALARSLGTNISAYKVVAFTISGMIAGTAGVLYLYLQRHVEPNLFGIHASLVFVVLVVIGGRSIAGPLVGAAVWVFVPELFLDPRVSELLFGVALAAVILLPSSPLALRWRRHRREAAAPPGPALVKEGT